MSEVEDQLEALRAEHRRLDAEIEQLRFTGASDQIHLARLKKRKLLIKDQIQMMVDDAVPDIIA